MVASRALSLVSLLPLCLGQQQGEEGQCIGERFHKVVYDVSDIDPETKMPRDFKVNVVPEPSKDELCPPENGGNTDKGVCVGVNTRDCQNGSEQMPINNWLTCERCFLGLVTDISYELDVQDNKLQKARLGFANTHLKGALELLASRSDSATVASGSFPIVGRDMEYTINFVVANVIPVTITLRVPTSLNYEVRLSSQANFRFGGNVDVQLTDHEIQWTPSGWSAPSSGSTSVTWAPVLSADATVTADIPLSLSSKLEAVFQKVLTYDMTFEPSLPIHAEARGSTSGGNAICVNSNADFKVDHSAALRFELLGQNIEVGSWGPQNLYQNHWDNVFDYCYDLPDLPDGCCTCVSNGGGQACASLACSARESQCTSCISSGGGKACYDRCGCPAQLPVVV